MSSSPQRHLIPSAPSHATKEISSNHLHLIGLVSTPPMLRSTIPALHPHARNLLRVRSLPPMQQPQKLTLSHQDPLLHTFHALKLSPSDPPSAGVILLSDIYGMATPDTLRQARHFSDQGWICFIPDLFSSHPHPDPATPSTPLQTEAWREQYAFPYDKVLDITHACRDYLMREEGVEAVGLVGYCYGGGRVIDVVSSEKGEGVAAGVSFYGTRIDPDLISRIKAPTLMMFGEEDPLVEMQQVEKIQSEVQEGMGRVVVYEGRGHGFVHRPKREEDVKDGQQALRAGVEWLKQYLEKA